MSRPKVGVTVDTAWVQRHAVENLLRRHDIPYNIAGTVADVRPIEVSGGQSLYQLSISDPSSGDEAALLERVLGTISDNAFPPPDNRVRLTPRQKEQWNGARFLCAHRREGHTVFVTDNAALFGRPDSAKRQRLSELIGTRFLSFAEFERWCSEPGRKGPRSRTDT